MRHFLGIPLVVWALPCVAMTILWIIVWPHRKVASHTDLRYFVLRWFHALTWFLGAIAILLASLSLDTAARFTGLAALGAYLAFLLACAIKPRP